MAVKIGMAVKREYVVVVIVTLLLIGACAIAKWGGLFTNAKLEIKEATCASMQEGAILAFNEARPAPWHPSGLKIREILESSDLPVIRASNGDVAEHRCRGAAVMSDGTHAKLSYKIYEVEGKAVQIVGIGNEGEMRIFRRD